jgi:hypothetical protein
VVFVADALGGWLVGQLADAGRKKLTELVLGSEQERALRQAADAAVWATAEEVSLPGGHQAEQVAMVISEVFRDPVPDAPRAGPVMLLEGMQAAIARQLAVLDDAGLTGTGQSSAEVLGVPGAVLADRLTGHLVREIIVGGSGGGPLAPLADQFNHELTRLQIGGLAAEVRDALARPGSGVTVAGWPLEEVTDPFALEVHRPVELDVPQPELPVLPVYVPREHDAALAEVVTAAVAGASGIAVLVGGSSTGKTRACWQALDLMRDLEAGWRLWHPIDPQAALGLPGAGPQTVVWLNEAQRHLDTADGTGERVAAGLRALLRDPTRGPVLVLATLWPQFWAELTASPSGGPDPHAQARELLTGRDITVPTAFTGGQLRQLKEAGDPRLVQAAAGSRDGQVIQYLAGAPELLHRYHNALPAARALIDAAMDAARLGMRHVLPRAFLEMAAPGYLTDTDWDLLPSDWLEQALDYTAKPAKGVRGPLGPIRARPAPRAPDSSGDQPAWQLADYLDQHGRRVRRGLIPPTSFWVAAGRYADPADLTSLAHAAAGSGLLRDAARLYKQASAAGHPMAGVSLVRLLHTVCPGDQRPGRWAVTYTSLDDPYAVAGLLGALREADATSQANTLLERDPAAHASLDDPYGVHRLLDALREADATSQVTTLATRAAAYVSVDQPGAVAELLGALRSADATSQVTTLATRAAAHVSVDNPVSVAGLLRALRKAGATSQVTTLATRAAAHVSFDFDDSMDVAALFVLIERLHEVGATSQAITLATGAAAHVRLDEPLIVGMLLNGLRKTGATSQANTLPDRDPAAHASLDYPFAVDVLLGALRAAGAASQANTLLDRDPAAHVSVDDPSSVAGLLRTLRAADATSQATTLATRAAAHASLDNPFVVAGLLDMLRKAGATSQASALLDRDPAAHASLDHPFAVATLLDALRAADATSQATALATRAAAHTSLDRADEVATLLDALRAADATSQAAMLATRAAAHTSLNRAHDVAKLLDALRQVGAVAQAAELTKRLPAAGQFQLFSKQEGRGEQFRFGLEADGRPAKPWAWTDLG